MIRKVLIAVLTVGALMNAFAWLASHRLELHIFHYYDYPPMGTRWMYKSSAGGAWTTSVDGLIGDDTISHICLTVKEGKCDVHFMRQLQGQATVVDRSFGGSFISIRSGVNRTWHRGGFHRYYGFGSSFAVLVVVLAAYPTLAFIRGPLRRWRRRKKGRCVKCGYSLNGNESGTCPECGTEVAEPRSGDRSVARGVNRG